MPSLSRSLEESLHRAIRLASKRHHEYSTLEHLLLALLDDEDAARTMRGCNVNLDDLRRDLTTYIDKELSTLVIEGGDDAKPTTGFQRVVQRAVMHVQNSGMDEIGGDHVLVALFSERESNAVYFLQQQNMSRLDAVNYLQHGIRKGGPWRGDQTENEGIAAVREHLGLILSVEHADADLSQIPAKIGLAALDCWKKGDPRSGPVTLANHRSSRCSFQFAKGHDQALPNGLRVALAALRPHKDLIDELSKSGATFKFYISRSGRVENEALDWTLLHDLADLKIDLQFGSYRA
jgi:hypothetical protein